MQKLRIFFILNSYYFIFLCAKIRKWRNKKKCVDNMDLEKERGITIKSHAIQMEYTYQGEKYILNLIDTPEVT